ncbi:MAG: ABC transporter substrate-binding protein, partial [Roseococcus sp.]
MKRRDMLATMGAAALAGPALAQPAQNRVLKFVPQANLTSLDPIWTTANITRNHGHMIYDSLYGVDADFQPKPQMAAGHVVDEDGKRVTITLRDGLKFHDGEPVRAQDVVPSITRWMRRNPFGQQLAAATNAVEVVDDKRLVFRLKKPFPLIFAALAQVSNSPAFIMPERLARTDPFQQVREAIGSGPFCFKADEYNSGSRVVYTRNPDYIPISSGTPSLTAGPKIANFDRVEWNIIVDAAT